jgi:hypothetical protein
MSLDLAEMATHLRSFSTLAQALRWGFAARPVWSVAEVVVQDEYTHDVVFTADGVPGALVLDCT